VPSLPIIEHLKVLKDILPCGFTRFVAPREHELALECPEDAYATALS
jgi:hypothetical protein